jgi:hypothetical protein
VPIACPSGGTENPEGFKFCGQCATLLTDPPPIAEELKVVTTLFCVLVGSTALGEKAYPEDVAGLLAGGTDDGPLGLREHYGPHYYAAFVLDPGGHRLEAVCTARA